MGCSLTRGVAGFLACLVFGCASSDSLDDASRGPIDLASGAIDTRSAEPASSETTLTPDGAGQYLIVQLAGPASSADLDALAAGVDRIYGYLPHDSYLVRVAPGVSPASLGAWSGVYRPEYKIARSVREAADWSAALADSDVDAATQTIMVQAYPDADLERIAAEVAMFPEADLVGTGGGSRFSRVRLRVPGDRAVAVAEALAELPEVSWIDVEGQRGLLNDTTIWVGQSGVTTARTTPIFDRGIHGEGQVVGFIDTGLDIDSCYFRDTTLGLPPLNVCDGGTAVDPAQRKVLAVDFLAAGECAGGIAATEWDATASHGTHVAGTLAGDNFVRPIVHDTADGMAPAAKLIVQDAGSGSDNCSSMPGIGCPVVDLKPFFAQAYAQGARLHSNSWGDHLNSLPHNKYTAASEDVDEFMWTHPDFLIFFAAGNSGSNPGTVFSPSTAKNGISVGATLHAASAESMAAFSSCGPTADNRIKPDLTIPGSSVLSARSDGNVGTNNCTTLTQSGTSQATPAAAGFGALVRQYFTDGFYPSGAAVAADGFAPSAALVKAALLNSSRQMTAAAAGTIPANCQGWGRILLEDGLFFAGQNRRLFVADDPGFPEGGAGQSKKFNFIVQANESLKATLVWTDFPSTPAASINLVNDLDLEVTGPAGTFAGNVFAGGVSQPGGTADRRNTVEQVLLATPGPGLYTIIVRAANVPVGPQPFALVVTGNAVLNQPPIASAGADQTGQAGTEVVLDGSASTDPDGVPSPLTFSWTQTGGPPVTLDGAATAQARYTPTALGAYTFRLEVSDGADQAEDTVVVTIANQPPVADAGADQTGRAGVAVQLDGSASNDPDDLPSPLTFAWIQTDGPPATLTGADAAQASFTPTALGTYTFRLQVSDGADQADDTVSITILNLPPVASAGPDQTGLTADPILLDGSASSDPDGVPAPLSFTWTQIAGPPASLSDAGTVLATFTPVALGTYTFQLDVSDGAASASDTVSVTILNRPPIANAGADRTGIIGALLALDGSASSDPDDLPSPLSFSWTQIAGPSVTLEGADGARPGFTPGALGTYSFRLAVSDGADQAEDTVTVTIVNQAPIANAGADQSGVVGFPILLDGSASTDPDDVPAPLSFAWTQIAGPPVTIGGESASQAGFTASLLGTYTFRLVVSDGEAQSDDTVSITILNQGPIASAGADQSGIVGFPILLDGSASFDPDGQPSPLSFSWSQIDGPPVTIAGEGAFQAGFTASLLGTYTFRLVVSDGAAESEDIVSVSILNQGPIADAGPDRGGLLGVLAALDGSASNDPDGQPFPLTYAWTQIDGPPVNILGADLALASFIPTLVATYRFRLVVSDGAAQSEDTISVSILNQSPTASAGPDRSGQVGTAVVLDGSASDDPDDGPLPLSFSWTQTAGPSVTLSGASAPQASFTPAVSGTYAFRLVVSDGLAQAEDSVTVTVAASTVVVFSDGFEQSLGWTANASGTDTATTGKWERATPQPTSSGGLPLQLAARAGSFDLVTGASAGASVGDHDIDGGTTSISSPPIALPSGQLTLSLAYYLAHLSNSSSADFLRVRVVGATTSTVMQELGTTSDDGAAWLTTSVDISAFAGQIVRIVIEAADASTASLVEAAIDDVKIEARL
jgi:hypothetical protein